MFLERFKEVLLFYIKDLIVLFYYIVLYYMYLLYCMFKH